MVRAGSSPSSTRRCTALCVGIMPCRQAPGSPPLTSCCTRSTHPAPSSCIPGRRRTRSCLAPLPVTEKARLGYARKWASSSNGCSGVGVLSAGRGAALSVGGCTVAACAPVAPPFAAVSRPPSPSVPASFHVSVLLFRLPPRWSSASLGSSRRPSASRRTLTWRTSFQNSPRCPARPLHLNHTRPDQTGLRHDRRRSFRQLTEC